MNRTLRWALAAVLGWLMVLSACTTPPDPGGPTTTPVAPGLESWKELRPAAVGLVDGRLALFKVNKDGRLEYRVQESAMGGANTYQQVSWLPAQAVVTGPVLSGSPSVVRNADNTLSVVALGADGLMYHLRQTTPDSAVPLSSFGVWQPMPALGAGLSYAGSPLVTEVNGDALREVIVLASDGNFWLTAQSGTGYVAWQKRFGAGLGLRGAPAGARRADGRFHVWFTAEDNTLRETFFDPAQGVWAAAQFASFGGSWASSPTSYLSASDRLTVAGSNPAKELAVQQYVPTTPVSTVASGSNGTPAAAKAGTSTYLFMIRDDGRVQFAPVNDAGAPGEWYVIDQPNVPAPQSPPNGTQVYAFGPVSLTSSAVGGADRYEFELWELVAGGGRIRVLADTLTQPSWELPAGTLAVGEEYEWFARAVSSATQLRSWYTPSRIVATSTVPAPVRTSPADGSVVDPFVPITLRARAVQGATSYRFSVARSTAPNTEVWSTTVNSTAAVETEVAAAIPANTLPVGSKYRWSVVSFTGSTQGTTSGSCCSTFTASTGATGSSMIARTNTGQGYWQIDYVGGVAAFGDATWSGQLAAYSGQASILPAGWRTVGIVAQPRSVGGYWVLADSGAIYSYGGAPYRGGADGLMQPGVKAVGMATTPSGKGYWIVGSDGSVFSFGDAPFKGRATYPAGETVTAITPRPDGGGYWILSSKGGVASLPCGCDTPAPPSPTPFFGSAVGLIPAADLPAVAIQATPTGDGYWILSGGGGIYTFPLPGTPNALPTYGAANNAQMLNGNRAAGLATTANGTGYWIMQDWTSNPNSGAVFTFGSAGYSGGANGLLTPGQPSAPEDGYRFFPRIPGQAPTLTSSAGTGSAGRTLTYRFRLSTDPTATTGIVDQSAFTSSRSWTPKAVNLKDGRTYFWRVDTNDGNSTEAGQIRSFTVERRFGSSEPSPFESAGPVAVNLASGNVTTGWSTPTVNGAGLSLTYNSLAPAETAEPGLPKGWSASWTGDNAAQSLIVTTGTVTVVMVDGSKDTFTWDSLGASGNSWRAERGSEAFLTEGDNSNWTYTTPDGTAYEFDAAGALTATTRPLDQRRSSALTYEWSDTPIGRRMVRATDPISQRSMRLYFQGDGQDGCAGTPPAGSLAAPTGMLCAVRLMDDRTYTVFYTSTSAALQQPAHMVGSDGTRTSYGWEVATVADLGGQYARLISVTDPLANDVIAAGGRANDASTRTEVRYQADGRADRVTRPAPAAGAARQAITISYSANGASVNRDGDARPNGYSRQVTVDALGRTTTEKDQAGRTTTTSWRQEKEAGDSIAWVQDPSGLRTGTDYDDRWKPESQWGPAPAAWFSADAAANEFGAVPTAANQAATPRAQTSYDEGLNGLALSFFQSSDLSGGAKRRAFRAGAGSFDIGAGGWDGLPADGWSMRAEGLLKPTVTGKYVFSTDSDGGIRVFVDNRLVVDGWYLSDQALRPSSGKPVQVDLTANKRVKIRVEYEDGAGNAAWLLRWTPPGGTRVTIPAAQLQPDYANVTRTIDADGRVVRTEFDDPSSGLASRTVQVVGGGNADLVSSATYEPDSATVGWRRQASRRLPAGASSEVTYAYYADQGTPVPNTCGVSGVNQAGRPKSTTAADPDGSGPEHAIKRWYVYDTAGRTRGLLTTTANVAESSLGSQAWVCTTFDARGRPTTQTYPAFGGAPARTVTYDYSNPLAVSVTDPAGTITNTTDLLGRTMRYRDALGNETTRVYDVADRPTSYSLLGTTVGSTYLPDGLLDTVTVDGKTVADSTYASDGRLLSVSYPAGATALGNGTTGEFSYDSLLRSSAITWKSPGGALIASENVVRSTGGNIVERWYDANNTNGSTPDFTYDGAGRLTNARVGSKNISYGFGDTSCGIATGAGRNSNRTEKFVFNVVNGLPESEASYCYDHADRLVSAEGSGAGSVSYDSRGNTMQIFGETRGYDIADRHLSTTKGSTTVTYTRDATDRIIERKVNGELVAQYVSSAGGDSPQVTIDAETGDAQWVLSLPGGVQFAYESSDTAASRWTYPNLQGSALAVADASGAKIGGTTTWDPDGNGLSGEVPDNMPGAFDYGWLGQHQRPLEHEAGLSPTIEMGARQYSAILGRFLEVDPVEGGTSNDYAYVDDPVNQFDLTGTIRVWVPPRRSFPSVAPKVVLPSKSKTVNASTCDSCRKVVLPSSPIQKSLSCKTCKVVVDDTPLPRPRPRPEGDPGGVSVDDSWASSAFDCLLTCWLGGGTAWREGGAAAGRWVGGNVLSAGATRLDDFARWMFGSRAY